MTFWCVHRETTPAADGEAICVRCGAVVRSGPLTEREFFATVEAVYRHPHRKACVRQNGEWCCAADCPVAACSF